MPEVVAHGKEEIGMRSCAICHLPHGQGGTQNAPVGGLPVSVAGGLPIITDFVLIPEAGLGCTCVSVLDVLVVSGEP